MNHSRAPSYLTPYLDAARQHGGGFGSLLWASETTQEQRFDAIVRLQEFDGRVILDIGCGRADLLDFLIERGIWPRRYIGLEAVPALADVAASKNQPNCQIVRADFVSQPAAMNVGADVIVCSGSLNTLDTPAFYATIRHAFAAAGESLVFNFLCSPHLAGRPFLKWRPPAEVMRIARQTCEDVDALEDYLQGDYTIAMRKHKTGTSE